MNSVAATAVVNAWEECQGRGHSDVALRLLRMAHPNADLAEFARLSIGERDRLLYAVREELLGSNLELRTACPECGERLELEATTQEFCPAYHEREPQFSLTVGEYDVRFRLPTSVDLAQALRGSPASARRRLWARCVVVLSRDQVVDVESVPDNVAVAVEEAMAELDGQAIVAIALECPECGNEWEADIDIVQILWVEIDGLARRMLADVHRLAKAYGWAESRILSLGSARRNFYLAQL